MSQCPNMTDRDVFEAATCIADIERTEGSLGANNLHILTKLLGYNTPFRDSFEEFLADNSGCIEAIHEWIIENMSPEWRDRLESVIPEDETEEMTEEEHEARVKAEIEDVQLCSGCWGPLKIYVTPGSGDERSLIEVFGCPHCDDN